MEDGLMELTRTDIKPPRPSDEGYEETAPSGTLQTVARALAVLQCFTLQEPELTAAEISSRSGLPRPTVYRLLATMESLGFIDRDPDTRHYRPGLEVVTLASIALNQMEVRRQALPELYLLVNRLRLGANLAILHHNEVFYLESIPHPKQVMMFSLVGRRNPLHSTALGKALLAGLSTARAEAVLRQCDLHPCGPHTLTTIEDLLTDIERVRVRGYAIDDEEWLIHSRCLAAPIYDRASWVVAALSISGPDTEIRGDNLESLARELLESAGRASYKLGYTRARM